MSAPQLRPLEEWTDRYIQKLPETELSWLEFRSGPWLQSQIGKREKLSKYVSAWANYDGGYLVIGSHWNLDGISGRTEDTYADLKIKGSTKEWLEDILPNIVEVPYHGFEVIVLPDPTNPSKGIVVIRIDPGDDAPYQALDRKFYGRSGSHLFALERRGILDILGRKKAPAIAIELLIHSVVPDIRDQSRIVCFVANDSDIVCEHFCVELLIPPKLADNRYLWIKNGVLDSGDDEKYAWLIRFKNRLQGPLLPRMRERFVQSFSQTSEMTVKISGNEIVSADSIRVKIYADSAAPIEYEIETSKVVRLSKYHG